MRYDELDDPRHLNQGKAGLTEKGIRGVLDLREQIGA